MAKVALEAHALGNLELEITHRSIRFLDFPAVSQVRRYSPSEIDRGEKQISPVPRTPIEVGPVTFREFPLLAGSGQLGRSVHISCNITIPYA